MRHFNPRLNTVVPNVSWGIGIHECDVLVVRPSGHAVEIEIKVSVSDLKADAKKHHGHYSNRIRELWFAMPAFMEPHVDLVPARAGILLLDTRHGSTYVSKTLRKPILNSQARKLTPREIQKVRHLGCMRLMGLMQRLLSQKE